MTTLNTVASTEDAQRTIEDEARLLLVESGLSPDTPDESVDTGDVETSTPEPTHEHPAGNPAKSEVEVEPAPAKPERDSKPESKSEMATSFFGSLGLSDEVQKSVDEVGYEEPTPIQRRTIPLMLQGRDVIAQAQTGSGKTAAFGLPLIEKIASQDRQVQALILAPTRELAIQVAEALHKYGHHKRIETLPIYGGQPYERQFRGLKRGPHIIVGTPGRVMDHMRRGTLKLDHLSHVVLDEADEMLDMGFVEDIEWILEQAPAERQTALFSATMPPRIRQLAGRYLVAPEHVSVRGKQMTVAETRQTYVEVPRSRKADALTRILDAESPSLAMIFCRTKMGVDELGESLLARGFAAETLHGDLSQVQRDRVMKKFRSGQADILVATDVAARGLDVPEVSHVFNFDIPQSAEDYVHRIGRTGRAGREGAAVTLITSKERRWLKQIERTVKARIERQPLPSVEDVADRRRDSLKRQLTELLAKEEENNLYLETVNDLSSEFDLPEIAAALLRLYAEETGKAIAVDKQNDDLAHLNSTGSSSRGEPGMTQLFINIGENFSVRPKDIVGAIANEARIPGKSIGAIDIFDTFSFVDVPNGDADRVIAAVSSSGIKGRSVNVEKAREGAGASPRTQRRDSYRGGRSGNTGNRRSGKGSYAGGNRGGKRRYAQQSNRRRSEV